MDNNVGSLCTKVAMMLIAIYLVWASVGLELRVTYRLEEWSVRTAHDTQLSFSPTSATKSRWVPEGLRCARLLHHAMHRPQNMLEDWCSHNRYSSCSGMINFCRGVQIEKSRTVRTSWLRVVFSMVALFNIKIDLILCNIIIIWSVYNVWDAPGSCL